MHDTEKVADYGSEYGSTGRENIYKLQTPHSNCMQLVSCPSDPREGGHEPRSRVWTWRAHAQLVSSVDWAMRWRGTMNCLSFSELDDLDIFEMDEIALEAFWARVWKCYLQYTE
ncbi:hypothetical protein N7510_007185 [Penicillium lagena]|uniref:uncharacterized protein n=1 Tax=Penicillium lagena TaxID=94218 RepID=UPI002541F271|nr:uncharacterized protein N7510_007185 [Penicillium lagena]KAJ5610466.1 hypothetical protein N7510_007185 [Penicillium lagena]